jgi:hypothetical protein
MPFTLLSSYDESAIENIEYRLDSLALLALCCLCSERILASLDLSPTHIIVATGGFIRSFQPYLQRPTEHGGGRLSYYHKILGLQQMQPTEIVLSREANTEFLLGARQDTTRLQQGGY